MKIELTAAGAMDGGSLTAVSEAPIETMGHSELSRFLHLQGGWYSERIQALSPEKQELLALFLEEANDPELEAPEEYIAPRTPLEKILASIWSQVLGVSLVGLEDNFFDLGGDSILSIRIVAKAEKFGLRLTPMQLFEHPTIAELAEVVELVPAGRTGSPPPDPDQVRLVQEYRALGSPAHLDAVVLELGRDLTCDLLRRAVRVLAVRLQREVQSAPSPEVFLQVDLSALDQVGQRGAIARAVADLERQAPGAGPRLVAACFELTDGGPRSLLLAGHGLPAEGLVTQNLLNDLQTCCRQLLRGIEPDLRSLGGLTPEDFPEADLTQDDLERILAAVGREVGT